MKRLTLLAIVLLFPGCSTIERAIPEVLPTARYCHEVQYARSGRDVKFYAECEAPFGGL